ncbi:hypothetical protein BJ742DRAFT_742276 [Cladochytrium replicatum]|nr:hypothetical protein BJ742DRAFT_742276 [Cladochytrium replicatum]
MPLLSNTLCLTTEERARRFLGKMLGSGRTGILGLDVELGGVDRDSVEHAGIQLICGRRASWLRWEISNVVELRISTGGLQCCVRGGDQNDEAHAIGLRAAFVGSRLRLDQLKRLKLDLNRTEFGKSPQLNKMLHVIRHIVDRGVSPQLFSRVIKKDSKVTMNTERWWIWSSFCCVVTPHYCTEIRFWVSWVAWVTYNKLGCSI